MKKHFNKLMYLLPPVAVILILCITFALKEVFPFGTTSIANAHASSDLAQLFVPMYTHIWDVLHGKASLFFTFLSGTGICTAGNISFSALLSPLNLFFYFVPRTQILEYMSIFLMLKCALMSFAAFFYFRKRFDCPTFYSVLFSVTYALSGYVMMYYVHMMWLDTAILFPFLLLSAEKALRGEKVYPFIIFFTLTLTMSLYIAFMVSLFLLIVGGAYLLLITKKEKRNTASFKFILGAVTSVLLSAFLNIPAALQLLFSKRASLNTNITDLFFNTDFSQFSHKLFVLVGLGFAIALLFKFFKHEKKVKTKWFCTIAILIPFLPIIFENINLIWHLGGYFGPANRMGFITVFIILAICAYTVSKYGDSLKTAKSTLFNIFILGCNALAIIAVFALFHHLNDDVNLILTQPQKLFFLIGITAIIFALTLMLKWKKLRNICISAVNIVLVLCLCTNFIAVSKGSITQEQSDAFIYDAVNLNDQLNSESLSYSEQALNRIKDYDGQLHTNYSFILSQAALSGWSHSLQLEIQAIARSFGYTRYNLLLCDNGGTLFSDALLGFKQTMSKRTLDDSLYTLANSENGMNVYNNKYTLPFSVLTNASILETDADYRKDAFNFSNEVYASVSGNNDKLFETIDIKPISTSENTYTYEVLVSGNQILYYYNNNRLEENTCSIKVNGKQLLIPYYGSAENTQYPSIPNNGTLTLGSFCDELVTVEITFSSNENIPSEDVASFALMPIDKLQDLCDNQYSYGDYAEANFSSLHIKKTVTDKEQNILLIPLYADNGWSCTINSQPIEIKTALGGFMCIELEEGENDVQLLFSPTGFKIGLIISVITLLLTIGFVILSKFKPIIISPIIGKASTFLFYAVSAAAVFVIYIVMILIALLFI